MTYLCCVLAACVLVGETHLNKHINSTAVSACFKIGRDIHPQQNLILLFSSFNKLKHTFNFSKQVSGFNNSWACDEESFCWAGRLSGCLSGPEFELWFGMFLCGVSMFPPTVPRKTCMGWLPSGSGL